MTQNAEQRIMQPAARGKRKTHYVPALDGLRAFAVLSVIFYHMRLSWAPGGLMGVTIFFVISGYLINGLLVGEHDATGTISLSQFWLRRVRRIIPAVLLAIAGTLVLCAILNPLLFEKARADLVPSLLFFNNWWQVFRDISYFEAAGSPSPLTHYWSLSIEEQFYIVWPVLLLILFKLKAPKKAIACIVAVLAVASGIEMAVLYDPLADPSRIYYGTDTRAVSLLIGALLAFVWPSSIFGHRRQSARTAAGRRAANIAGVAALAGLVAIVVFTNSYTSFPYYGGIVLVSVLTAVLIAVLVVPNTWVARLMQAQPLVWIGKRSYGMYLWHFPIILATANASTTIEIPWWVRLSQLILIFAVSDLSYRFVENPIRQGALGNWWRSRKSRADGKADTASPAHKASSVATVACCSVLACAAAIAVAVMPHVSPNATVTPVQAQSQSAPTGSTAGSKAPSSSSKSQGSSSAAAKKAQPAPSFKDMGIAEYVIATAQYEEASLSKKQRAKARKAMRSFVERQVDTIVETIDESYRKAEEERRRQEYEDLFLTEHLNDAGGVIYNPVLIGDSVAAGCENEFYRAFPNGHSDALVNRNIWESPYGYYCENNQAGSYAVFCLGTNNAATDEQIDELLAAVPKGTKVVMVNIRCPRDWEAQTNAAIANAPARHSCIVAVVDWYGESAGHDEYFYEDGIHLNETGAKAYIGLIQQAIEQSIE